VRGGGGGKKKKKAFLLKVRRGVKQDSKRLLEPKKGERIRVGDPPKIKGREGRDEQQVNLAFHTGWMKNLHTKERKGWGGDRRHWGVCPDVEKAGHQGTTHQGGKLNEKGSSGHLWRGEIRTGRKIMCQAPYQWKEKKLREENQLERERKVGKEKGRDFLCPQGRNLGKKRGSQREDWRAGTINRPRISL